LHLSSGKIVPGIRRNVKHVIVIDDDKAVGGAIKLWLEIEGATVTFVDDGATGIEAIKTGDFDLVLIDLFMPGINRIEAIRTVHALKPTLPIIAMSGLIYDQEATAPSTMVEQARQSGAAKAIHKPFRPRDLMQAIEGCLGEPLRAPKGSEAGTQR
jgi:CheY-like chemotaxis protein